MSDDPDSRTAFIAGSTGATGRTLLRIGRRVPDAQLRLIAHQRPKPGRESGPGTRVVALSDEEGLRAAMKDTNTVIQLIGTMRKRFSTGDTYETSDIGTTRQLAEAARSTSVDHFVLLSSVGAGRPIGPYLKAKAKAEAVVIDSGIPYTIFRPSAFVGEGHRPPPGMGLLTRTLRLSKYEPISLEDLAGAILYVAEHQHALGEILEGDKLWRIVEAARVAGTIPTQRP